jgi:ABC-type protease/lipase transport system fused ATPase/permease subunit
MGVPRARRHGDAEDQLLSESTADKICFFDPIYDWERMMESARLAGAHDEIMRPVRGCVWTRVRGSDSRPVMAGEIGIARRRIGHEDLIARSEPRTAASLFEIAALLD